MTLSSYGRRISASVSTFEYLFGHATTNAGQFVLLAVYRPCSCAPTELFFDELSTVFERGSSSVVTLISTWTTQMTSVLFMYLNCCCSCSDVFSNYQSSQCTTLVTLWTWSSPGATLRSRLCVSVTCSRTMLSSVSLRTRKRNIATLTGSRAEHALASDLTASVLCIELKAREGT